MAGTYNYTIESRDVDASMRVRPYAMGDLVLKAAGDEADILGFGVRDLNTGAASEGVEASWVLSRVAIEMHRLPTQGEQVAIYTWVSDYGRLMTTRNMVISDERGEQIGAAVTQWVMIDVATRRPMDLSALSNKSTSLVDREPPIERPKKLGVISVASEEILHKVVYSDIDFNGHAGSMKYIEWMVNSLPAADVARLAYGFRLDINYLHEALLGQELTICRDGGVFDIRNTDGTSMCRAEVGM